MPAARYVLRRDGPPIAAGEVEHSARLAIEVLILWQSDVLSVAHVAPRGSVYIGGTGSCADIALPEELLGGESLCVAVCTRGEVSAVLPANARGWRTLPNGQRCPLPSPAEQSAATGQLLPLPLGNRVHLSLGELELQVAAVSRGVRPPGASRSASRPPRSSTSPSRRCWWWARWGCSPGWHHHAA